MGVTLYTVRQVCEAWNISRATLYRLVQRGQVKPVKIGRATRFRSDELEQFLRERHKEGNK